MLELRNVIFGQFASLLSRYSWPIGVVALAFGSVAVLARWRTTADGKRGCACGGVVAR